MVDDVSHGEFIQVLIMVKKVKKNSKIGVELIKAAARMFNPLAGF